MVEHGRKITKLRAQKRVKDRVNVYLDDVYAFPISAEAVMKHSLKIGVELSDEKLERLLLESELERLIAKIINFLSYRPRSEKEITDRLYQYTVDYTEKREMLIEQVIAFLRRRMLINDEEFAEWYVSERQTHKPRSQKHLEAELYKKGITKEIIEEIVRKTNFDENEEIQKILDKYRKRKNEKQLINFLLRKGFRYENIKKCMQA